VVQVPASDFPGVPGARREAAETLRRLNAHTEKADRDASYFGNRCELSCLKLGVAARETASEGEKSEKPRRTHSPSRRTHRHSPPRAVVSALAAVERTWALPSRPSAPTRPSPHRAPRPPPPRAATARHASVPPRLPVASRRVRR
jgi:hypothetical protein